MHASLTDLLYLVLATLGSYDILKRLLPTRVPVVAGKLLCVAIPWILFKYVGLDIVLPLCVPGVLLLVAGFVTAEPNVPWWDYISDYLRLRRHPRLNDVAPSRIGQRLPNLPRR